VRARPDPVKERELTGAAMRSLESLREFYVENSWKNSARIVHQALAKLAFLKKL
jgi:hypothetical protein